MDSHFASLRSDSSSSVEEHVGDEALPFLNHRTILFCQRHQSLFQFLNKITITSC